MHSIKIGTWNVNGLGKKLKDEDVVKYVNSVDFVAVVETWTTVRSNVNFSGYSSIHKMRRRQKKRGRPNGGILLLYKTKYGKFVTQLPSDHDDLLIVKIDKEAIGHSKDLIMFITYVTPKTSANQNMFEILESNLVRYKELGETIILGDFNARTGTLSDVETAEDPAELPQLPDSGYCELAAELERNCDKKTNNRGSCSKGRLSNAPKS